MNQTTRTAAQAAVAQVTETHTTMMVRTVTVKQIPTMMVMMVMMVTTVTGIKISPAGVTVVMRVISVSLEFKTVISIRTVGKAHGIHMIILCHLSHICK